MKCEWFWGIGMCLLLGSLQANEIQFDRDIQPILVRHCIACHGPDQQKGNLRLDLRSSFEKGGKSGPVIDATQPEQSPLLQRIRTKDSDLRMPPEGEPLSQTQQRILQRWIHQGAVWPDGTDDESILLRHWA